MPSSLSVSQSPPSPAPTASDLIKDVDLATFMADVIEASRAQPVIVNFFSTRSNLCKQLTPILEKLVLVAKGALRLAKVDIDRNMEIAQQMGVQSVPAVFAFFQGRPMDGFAGLLPEAQVKTWIDRILKTAGGNPAADASENFDAALKQAADFMAANDFATAQSIYADILDTDPANAAAYAGLIRCTLAAKNVDLAQQMLTNAPPDVAKDKAMDAVRTAVELAVQAQQGGSVEDLQAKLAQNPADHQTRLDLAMAHYAAGQKEEAIDQLLELVKRDRAWNDAAARKQLVKLFDALGPADPLTTAGRKRLSSILFS